MLSSALLALLAAPIHAAECPTGQQVTADTAGECCWPGQGFEGTFCVGTPTACPDGWRVAADTYACAPEPCPAGQVAVDGGPWCCWEGQRWSTESLSCAGTPTCPDGWQVEGETCRQEGRSALLFRFEFSPSRQGRCPKGQHVSADGEHCCAPGEAWSSAVGHCVSGISVTPVRAAPRPTTLPETARILGPLDRDAAARVIGQARARLGWCLSRGGAHGQTLTLRVEPDGSTSAIDLAGADQRVASCLDGARDRLTFPAAPVPRTVTLAVEWVMGR